MKLIKKKQFLFHIFATYCQPDASLTQKDNHMKTKILSAVCYFALISALSLQSCYEKPSKKYTKGYFPDSVCNLEIVNSIYDEINMDLRLLRCTNFLTFASNRNTQGGSYDLNSKIFTFIWNQENGKFDAADNLYGQDELYNKMAEATRTDANEYGPTFYRRLIKNEQNNNQFIRYYLFYSDDQKGTLDLRMLTFDEKGTYSENLISELKDKIVDLSFASNQQFNEGYFTLLTEDFSSFLPSGIEAETSIFQLVFCTDETGNYDLYKIDIPQNENLDSFLLQASENGKTPITELNSAQDDRCPSITSNLMVFSSNRPGGLGGYDFYYSILKDGKWSTPVNFGEPINSPYDEYRARVVKAEEYENDVLIFSSNRPGGNGGYDLYYTGIELMREHK